MDRILGQQTAVETLCAARDRGRIASAYLFEGPSGVGKQKLAVAFATSLIAKDDIDVARRIDAGSHPEVRVFSPRDEGQGNIKVDFLREEILPVAQYAPFEADAAFLIFPNADISFPENHPESANALLKTLEEPRARVHFVLLSERPDRLLPTIRSRCQTLKFRRLAPGHLRTILTNQGAGREEIPAAVALADGRADRALMLIEEGAADRILSMAMSIDQRLFDGKPGDLIGAAELLARSDDLPLALDSLCTFYRDVASVGLGLSDEMLRFSHHASQVHARAQRVTPEEAALRVEKIQRSLVGFERNANRQSTMDALLFELAHP